MNLKLTPLLVLFLFFVLTNNFKLSTPVDYLAQGFKRVTTKFGEKIWHRNQTASEEVILLPKDEPIT